MPRLAPVTGGCQPVEAGSVEGIGFLTGNHLSAQGDLGFMLLSGGGSWAHGGRSSFGCRWIHSWKILIRPLFFKKG